jgi:toxin ParE1/3/4
MPAPDSSVIWAPAAKKDLRDIWNYFIDVASPEIADRLLRDIVEAGTRAGQRPLAWRARDEIMPGLRSILVHPYVLFYRVKPGTIEIVRIVHQRRNLSAILFKRKR